jgi:hypothetical protein
MTDHAGNEGGGNCKILPGNTYGKGLGLVCGATSLGWPLRWRSVLQPERYFRLADVAAATSPVADEPEK